MLFETATFCFRRYLALCVGETRVRFDLQAPLRPLVKKSSHGKTSGKLSVSPTTLRCLSQVWSLTKGQSFTKLICRQHLTSSYLVFSAAVVPHQLNQCDGIEPGTYRVSVAHDRYRHHLVTRPPE